MSDTIQMWSNIWKWILLLGGGAFCLLVVFVFIRGLSDIRSLFAMLRKQGEEKAKSRS